MTSNNPGVHRQLGHFSMFTAFCHCAHPAQILGLRLRLQPQPIGELREIGLLRGRIDVDRKHRRQEKLGRGLLVLNLRDNRVDIERTRHILLNVRERFGTGAGFPELADDARPLLGVNRTVRLGGCNHAADQQQRLARRRLLVGAVRRLDRLHRRLRAWRRAALAALQQRHCQRCDQRQAGHLAGAATATEQAAQQPIEDTAAAHTAAAHTATAHATTGRTSTAAKYAAQEIAEAATAATGPASSASHAPACHSATGQAAQEAAEEIAEATAAGHASSTSHAPAAAEHAAQEIAEATAHTSTGHTATGHAPAAAA
ncbi:MAG: hypothetical protein RKL24_06055, partial [Defluviicoccus sp.]|nr:hypothetical protein [Defluviicoccus sp.]